MTEPIRLSKPARKLLHLASQAHVEVTPDNLEAYCELARSGIMVPLSGFLRGPEAVFRFTQEGWNRREELQLPPWRRTLSAMLRRIFPEFSLIGRSVPGAR
jgi:hypothetical protein